MLHDAFDVEPGTGWRTVEATAADRRTAALLGVRVGAPLLLLTSLGGRPAGAEELGLLHLTKPVKAGALRTVVASALGAGRAPARTDSAPVRQRQLRVLLAEEPAAPPPDPAAVPASRPRRTRVAPAPETP